MESQDFHVCWVQVFTRRHLAEPLEAISFADWLFRGAPFTGTAAEAARDFQRLGAWERQAVVDELRRVLDRLLAGKFWEYVRDARAVDEAMTMTEEERA